MSTYVALLRGINVGGKNLLPMPALADMFAGNGCAKVRTYIQSGNVLFEAKPSVIKQLPARITAAISDSFGYRIPVILRSAEELQAVAVSNPFADRPEEMLHVLFLDNAPAPEQIASLDRARSSPDAFHVLGREVYLHLPNGAGRTKLTNAYFDSKLRTANTLRNWRTVKKLVELTALG